MADPDVGGQPVVDVVLSAGGQVRVAGSESFDQLDCSLDLTADDNRLVQRDGLLLGVSRVLANSARIVDEWLPIKDWSTEAVKEWHTSAPVPYCWTYDSVPRAGDWQGTSRCSCSLCVFASKSDVLLALGRRPRLAALYAEVEQVRGDSFCAHWRITDLLRHAESCGAPDPGVVCPDDGPEFTALETRCVRA